MDIETLPPGIMETCLSILGQNLEKVVKISGFSNRADGRNQEVCEEDGKYWNHYLGRELCVCHLPKLCC